MQMGTYKYVYMQMHTCICANTHARMRVHTHTHTNTHISVNVSKRPVELTLNLLAFVITSSFFSNISMYVHVVLTSLSTSPIMIAMKVDEHSLQSFQIQHLLTICSTLIYGVANIMELTAFISDVSPLICLVQQQLLLQS